MDGFPGDEDNPGDGYQKVVVTEVTNLRQDPKGKVLRELAAGTRVHITGEAQHKFLPVAVPELHFHGWFAQGDIAPVTKPVLALMFGVEGIGAALSEAEPILRAADVSSRVAGEARKYVGARYVWGTHGPTTFDCLGLVYWVVLQVTGEEISPDSHAQFNLPTPVSGDVLMPGDRVFYDTMNGHEVREGNTASHGGILVGDGRMVTWVRDFRSGEAVLTDGVYQGATVQGDPRWLRTAETEHLAVHSSAVMEPI